MCEKTYQQKQKEQHKEISVERREMRESFASDLNQSMEAQLNFSLIDGVEGEEIHSFAEDWKQRVSLQGEEVISKNFSTGVRNVGQENALRKSKNLQEKKQIAGDVMRDSLEQSSRRSQMRESREERKKLTAKSKEIAEELGRVAECYTSWKKNMGFVTCRQIQDLRLLRMLSPYEEVLKDYRVRLRRYNTKESIELIRFFNDYDELMRSKEELKKRPEEQGSYYTQAEKEAYARYLGKNSELEGMMKLTESAEDQYTEDDKSDVTPQQYKEINQIDQWIVRNSNEVYPSFINKLLALPAQKRLLLYYSIEHGDHHKITEAEVPAAKLYHPDLEAFKDKMLASKFKFWKRHDGNEIYWHKLEDALESVSGLRLEHQNNQEQVSGENGQNQNTYIRQVAEQNQAEIEALERKKKLSKDEEKLLELKKAQNAQQNSAQNLRDLLEAQKSLLERRDGGEYGAELELNQNQKELQKAFAQMTKDTHALNEAITGSVSAWDRILSATKMTNEYGGYANQGALGAISYAKDEIGGMKEMVDGASSEELKKMSEGLTIALPDMQKIMQTSAAFASLGVVTALLGLVDGISNMVTNSTRLTLMDYVEGTIGLIGTARGGAVSTVSAINMISGSLKSVEKTMQGGKTTLETNLKTASTALQLAAIGVDTTMGVARLTKAAVRESKLNSAIEKFQKNHVMIDEEKTDTLEERMVRLSKRNTDRLYMKGTGSFISAGIGAGIFLATAGMGALASALVMFGGRLLTSAIASGLGYSGADKHETIDDFLGTDAILKNEDAKELEAYLGDTRGYRIKQKEQKASYEKRKTALRRDLVGRLGFSSTDSFMRKIVTIQGEQLYDKLFKDANGNFIGTRAEGFLDHKKQAEPYVKLVQSFGCKVRFGNSIDECRPDLKTMIKKMLAK